jgi:hypothetical protein
VKILQKEKFCVIVVLFKDIQKFECSGKRMKNGDEMEKKVI